MRIEWLADSQEYVRVRRVPGTEVILAEIPHGDLVRWGDGATYYERLSPMPRLTRVARWAMRLLAAPAAQQEGE